MVRNLMTEGTTDPSPARAARPTDGDTVLKASGSVTLTWKHVAAILGALGVGGGFLYVRADKAEDKGQAATQATATVDVEAAAAYGVWQQQNAALQADVAKLAASVNALVARVAVQDAALAGTLSRPDRAAFRLAAKAKPTPKVQLAPKPVLPPTPEAAAAAVAPPVEQKEN
jgi:hypothetical protein